jgi:hypothetical protein
MSETKWLDLIKLVNSGQPVNSRYDGGVHEADAADFSEIFGFGPSWSEEFSRRVKKHWINSCFALTPWLAWLSMSWTANQSPFLSRRAERATRKSSSFPRGA